MSTHLTSRRCRLLALLLLLTLSAPAAGADYTGEPLQLTDFLVIAPVGQSRRSAVHTDAVEALLVTGSFSVPEAGDTVDLADGTSRRWSATTADEGGWVTHRGFRGGWAYTRVVVDLPRTVMLHARGHSTVYLNGRPRAGDPYNAGTVRLPVRLEAGSNDLLFRVRRGRLWARIDPPRAPIMFHPGDRTLPDLIVGEPAPVRGAIVVINTTDTPLEDLTLVTGGDGMANRSSKVPIIGPRTWRKVPLWFGGDVDPARGHLTASVALERVDGGGVRRRLDETTVTLRVRRPDMRHRRTFLSEIDGSVQYYGVTPRRPGDGKDGKRSALILTLHGAGVEGMRQASVYRPKDWAHVVAPTNRRPFGFDWEDWGRLDAMEVLAAAVKRYDIDPDRVYLTGHSMGGHGTWHLGVTFPDRFAAIGPSAGWVSFFSYAGARSYDDDTPVETILRRATAPSDTAALARNTLHHGVYVLHGEKDDNVPVREARFMRDLLGEFHEDFDYHEQPGAGHWWGDRCCDWPPMMAFFRERRRPTQVSVDQVEFRTTNPGVSAYSRWIGVLAQPAPLELSVVKAQRDRIVRRYLLETTNVSRLAIDLAGMTSGAPVTVEIDHQPAIRVGWPETGGSVFFEVANDLWSAAATPAPSLKGPHRYGPFKDAFRNRVQLVYGTSGSDTENDWAYAKARYDAETFWYRGNGSLDVVADTDFDPTAAVDRNVILYGNADSNTAWSPLLGDASVSIESGVVVIGERRLRGDDLGCLFAVARRGSDRAMVGVVGGTGLVGMRLTDQVPYFVSGVALPDVTVFEPGALRHGVEGVVLVGFLGADWSVESGTFAWGPSAELRQETADESLTLPPSGR